MEYATAAAKSLQLCPTLCDPIDSSPPGSPSPWDSPGKNTGVGCHFLLQCMKVKIESESESEVLSDPQRPHGLQPSRLLHPWDFPGKSTGVGCHRLLQYNQSFCILFWIAEMATPGTVPVTLLALGNQAAALRPVSVSSGSEMLICFCFHGRSCPGALGRHRYLLCPSTSRQNHASQP